MGGEVHKGKRVGGWVVRECVNKHSQAGTWAELGKTLCTESDSSTCLHPKQLYRQVSAYCSQVNNLIRKLIIHNNKNIYEIKQSVSVKRCPMKQ